MASGDQLVELKPNDAEQPIGLTLAALISIPTSNKTCLAFDGAADESARFAFVLPRCYAGGGITARVFVRANYDGSSTTKTVNFAAAFMRHQLDVTAGNAEDFAAPQAASVTIDQTAYKENCVDIPFTDGAQMDSIAVGEEVWFKLTRDVSEDDLAADALVTSIELRET